MRFTIDSDKIKAMASVIGSVTNEAKVSMRPEELSILAVDPAHIAMVGMTIPSKAMPGWNPDCDEIGLDMVKLAATAKLMGETAEVEIDDGQISFRSGNLTRRMSLLDTSAMSTPKIPNINMGVSVCAKAKDISNALKGMATIDSDAVTFYVKNDSFTIYTETDTDDIAFRDNGTVCKVVSPGEACSTFPKDYIMDAFKTIPATMDVMLSFDSDYPIEIRFTDGEMDGFFLIAPRVEAKE